MRFALAVVALAAPFAAVAQSTPAPTLHQQVLERYCEKLRESPTAFVHLVRRLAPIHGYGIKDFAPDWPGDPVKADCRVSLARVAEVHALAGIATVGR